MANLVVTGDRGPAGIQPGVSHGPLVRLGQMSALELTGHLEALDDIQVAALAHRSMSSTTGLPVLHALQPERVPRVVLTDLVLFEASGQPALWRRLNADGAAAGLSAQDEQELTFSTRRGKAQILLDPERVWSYVREVATIKEPVRRDQVIDAIDARGEDGEELFVSMIAYVFARAWDEEIELDGLDEAMTCLEDLWGADACRERIELARKVRWQELNRQIVSSHLAHFEAIEEGHDKLFEVHADKDVEDLIGELEF